MAYYQVEPWGFEFENQMMARQVWATLQVHAGKRKIDERDYPLRFEPKRPLTPEEYRAKSMRAYAGHGGKIGA